MLRLTVRKNGCSYDLLSPVCTSAAATACSQAWRVLRLGANAINKRYRIWQVFRLAVQPNLLVCRLTFAPLLLPRVLRLGVKGLEAMLKAKFSKMKDGVFKAEDDDM